MSERGLFYPDGSFQSDRQIKQKLYLQGDLPPPLFETPLPIKRNYSYWAARFRERQQQFIEVAQVKDHIVVRLPSRSLIGLIGDTHIGSPTVDYSKLEQDVELIVNTPGAYLLLFGDIVDGFFFNPAQMEQMEQPPEQFQYMKSLVNYLGEHGKLLAGWGGDHDLWAEKMGLSAYEDFTETSGGHYMHGVGHVTFKLGEFEYKLSGAHRHKGFSIYNLTHSSMRLYRDNAEGADVIVTAHNHRKAHTEQAIREFGGTGKVVHFISLGTYKPDDRYIRKRGLGKANKEEMYGCALVLNDNEKKISYYHEIGDAVKSW
jgi:hypothetical protein